MAGCLGTRTWVCPWNSETGSGPLGRVAAASVPSSETVTLEAQSGDPLLLTGTGDLWESRSIDPRPFATLREP